MTSSYIASVIRKQRDQMVVFLWLCPFSLFIQYRTPSNEMVLSIFGVVFQSLVKLLWKLPQKIYVEACVIGDLKSIQLDSEE